MTRDGIIAPVDFLVVVNAINRQVATGESANLSSGYSDINGDQFLTSIDALALANWFVKQSDDIAAIATIGEIDGEGEEIVCNTPPVTVSVPSDVDEYSIFTVSGTAKHAETIQIAATGFWEYVDVVGFTPGWSFDPETGAFSQMLIFIDDHPTDTAEDLETITVAVTGACAGTVSANVLVHNVDVSATAAVAPDEIDEGNTVSLMVTWTDAVTDGQTIVVDWGDGDTSTITYSDLEPPPPPLQSTVAFLVPPELATITEWFSHQYLDDNPTTTPSDDYVVNVTVSDNDTSVATTDATVTVNNVDPEIIVDEIIPLDNVIENGQIDEIEGFRVLGHVTDTGILDTHTGTVKADLNWDGDTDDSGEQQTISGGGGFWTFDQTFGAVPDDGVSGAWNNETSSDELSLLVEILDDDTGFSSDLNITNVFNAPPTLVGEPELIPELDEDETLTAITVAGSFEDVSTGDAHDVVAEWADGVTNSVRLSPGISTYTLQRPVNDGDYPLLPLGITVTDDDLGTDSLVLPPQVCGCNGEECGGGEGEPAIFGNVAEGEPPAVPDYYGLAVNFPNTLTFDAVNGGEAFFLWKWAVQHVVAYTGGSARVVPRQNLSIIQKVNGTYNASGDGATTWSEITFNFTEINHGESTDNQEMRWGTLKPCDYGTLKQSVEVFVTEQQFTTNPPPPPPAPGTLASRFDDKGKYVHDFKVNAGIVGGGWVRANGYPKTTEPYAPGGYSGFDPGPYSMINYAKVANYNTELKYAVRKNGTSWATVTWTFSWLLDGAVVNTETKTATLDPAGGGGSINLGAP